MRCGVRWLSGLRQQLGQEVHRIEHNDVIALETLGTRHGGTKCEDGHARRESGLHAGNTVFNHRATIWLYGHRVGREQENRGIRLAVCDVIRTEDAPRESLGHSREAEFEIYHRMATTGRDATRHRDRIQGRDHAVDGFELAFAHLAHPQFEFDLPIDGTTDVFLDDRLHVHRRTTNESFNDLRLGEWPTEFGEYLRLGANREPFTVDEDHPVLLRLTPERAHRLAGELLRDGIDRPLVWKPSRADRKSHPGLPPDASVTGRLIVGQVKPNNGAEPFLLALFTSLLVSTQEVLELYGRRWNIETDLRTLKSTLSLDQLTCTTPDMVAKEIDIAIAAYNLVRAVTWLASEQSGIPPRGYGFTKIRRLVNVFGPKIAAAANQQEADRMFQQLMYYVQQAKLPQRKRKRPSYPREVWNKGARFPNH